MTGPPRRGQRLGTVTEAARIVGCDAAMVWELVAAEELLAVRGEDPVNLDRWTIYRARRR